jgi:aspartate aminotransferase/aromatic-amino-acid transaminase
MTFVRKSADVTPIVDTVFAIVAKAKEDKAKIGAENVVDATIGSLYGEDEKLVALDEVFNHYDTIDHRVKAAYAASFTGNPDFRDGVYKWVVQNTDVKLQHSVIATPGGSGAVSMSITTFLDQGETLLIPDVAWGSYSLMAHENNINYVKYTMFDGDHFNLQSVKDNVNEILKKQDRIVMIINDPCHNPTGYSLTMQEWKELVAFMNEVSKKVPFILIDDIAYIDYSNHLETSRDYMATWNELSAQAMVVVAFSCSKTLTSYGLRCGAAVILAQDSKDVREAEIIMEKKARATWSNIPNAAMANFVWLVNDDRENFLKEKQKYIDLMKQRSSLFLKEAKEAGLATYPYKEGFFVTLRMNDNDKRSQFHEALMKEHIYTVQVNHGIRVAVCSLPLKKVAGLAAKMKKIQQEFD